MPAQLDTGCRRCIQARGATNKVLGLKADSAQLAAGLFTASTGNHALAMTHALDTARSTGLIPAGTAATIFVSAKTAPSKVASLLLPPNCTPLPGHAAVSAVRVAHLPPVK